MTHTCHLLSGMVAGEWDGAGCGDVGCKGCWCWPGDVAFLCLHARGCSGSNNVIGGSEMTLHTDLEREGSVWWMLWQRLSSPFHLPSPGPSVAILATCVSGAHPVLGGKRGGGGGAGVRGHPILAA